MASELEHHPGKVFGTDTGDVLCKAGAFEDGQDVLVVVKAAGEGCFEFHGWGFEEIVSHYLYAGDLPSGDFSVDFHKA